jgi:hypothetical protein
VRFPIRANQCSTQATRKHSHQDGWPDDCVNGWNYLWRNVDGEMRELAEAFIAAAFLVGIVIWTVKVIVEVLK